MILKAGNENEKVNDSSESYIDLYEWGLPEEIRQKTDELKMKMRIIRRDYLKELKNNILKFQRN